MLLLDTHAWVWWVTRPERLSRTQRAAVDRTLRAGREPILLSIISCWEVALLCQQRKLGFGVAAEVWLEQASSVPGLDVAPLSLPIVSSAARLTMLRDPADMLIVASAQHHGARLVTSDDRIIDAAVVPTVG